MKAKGNSLGGTHSVAKLLKEKAHPCERKFEQFNRISEKSRVNGDN